MTPIGLIRRLLRPPRPPDCFCGGFHADWAYHHPEGCGKTLKDAYEARGRSNEQLQTWREESEL